MARKKGELTAGLMKPVLQNQGVLGADSLTVDSVTVSLVNPITLIEGFKTTGLLLLNGSLAITLPESASGTTCYLKINHRNLIEAWSAVPVTIGLSNGYDFTVVAAAAFGGNQIEIEPGAWAMFNADMNQDQFVDAFDFSFYDYDSFNFTTVYSKSDLNGDGFVDSYDFSVFEYDNLNFITSIHP